MSGKMGGTHWNSNSIFPTNNYGRELVLVQDGIVSTDPQRITKMVKGWTPYSGYLIGDGGERLLPAVCIPAVSTIATRSYMVKYGISVVLWLLGACFVSFTSIAGGKDKGVAETALLVALYFILDYTVLRKQNALEERARFIYWIRNDAKVKAAFLSALAFTLGMGGLQWLLAQWCGSTMSTIEAYGLVFDRALSGEWWRFLVGPYLHASITHYVGNASLFPAAFAFSYALIGRRTIYVFVVANLVVPALSIPWVSGSFDAYAGISSGIFSLFGLTFVHVAINRKEFPYGLAVNIAALSLLSMLASHILIKNSSFVSHALGFLLGCGVDAVMNRKSLWSSVERGR
jgi:hypothetical protein